MCSAPDIVEPSSELWHMGAVTFSEIPLHKRLEGTMKTGPRDRNSTRKHDGIQIDRTARNPHAHLSEVTLIRKARVVKSFFRVARFALPRSTVLAS